jgi:uncharacterized delta-60 repeat protein
MTQEVNVKHPQTITNRARRVAAAALSALVALPAVAVADPGQLDTSFGCGSSPQDGPPGVCTTNLKVPAHDRAMGVAADEHGHTWVAGYSLGGTRDYMSVARYNKSGLDTSFNGKGWTLPAGPNTRGSDVVATRDGGAVIAGYQTRSEKKLPLIVKLQADGRLAAGGKVVQMLPNPNWEARLTSIARQNDDKIVVAGPLENKHTDERYAFVARYTEAGKLDKSFNPGPAPGMRVVPIRHEDDRAGELDINDVAIDNGGRIILVGTASYITKNNKPSEVNGGKPAAIAIALESNGAFPSTKQWTNHQHGVRLIPFATTEHAANAVAVQPDGKLVVAGHRVTPKGRHTAMTARFSPDGTLDRSRPGHAGYGGGNGVTSWKGLNGRNLSASDLAFDHSGNIVVTVHDRAGTLTPDKDEDRSAAAKITPDEDADHWFTVLRYYADGAAELNWGAPEVGNPPPPAALGEVLTNIYPGAGLVERAEALAVRPDDGAVVVAGHANPPNPLGVSLRERFAVAVYRSS